MTKNYQMKPELKYQLTQVSGDCTFGLHTAISEILTPYPAASPPNTQMHQFKEPYVYLLTVIKSILNV